MRCIVLLSNRRELLLKILVLHERSAGYVNQYATKLRKVNNASNMQMFNRQIHNLISLEKYFFVNYLTFLNRMPTKVIYILSRF